MPNCPTNRTVAEIRKSQRENFRISIRSKRGDVGCELRVAKADARGVMVEGPKGCRIPLARLPAVIEGLQDAQRVAERLGLMRVAAPGGSEPEG